MKEKITCPKCSKVAIKDGTNTAYRTKTEIVCYHCKYQKTEILHKKPVAIRISRI